MVGIVLAGIQISTGLNLAFENFLLEGELRVRFFGAAVRSEGPDQLLLPPIRRNLDPEDPLLPSWEKVRRLTPIHIAGFQFVIGARGNDEFLLPIPIEISEHEGEGPIRVPQLTIEARHDVLPAQEFRLRIVCGKLSLRGHATRDKAGGQYAFQQPVHHSPVLVFLAATRCSKSAWSR